LCSAACKGYAGLTGTYTPNGSRAPTDAELRLVMKIQGSGPPLGDSPVESSTSQFATTNTMELQQNLRPFKILFVPDPMRALSNRTRAENDLSFVRTMLSSDEFNQVLHLEGSILKLNSMKQGCN
jgi:hypothetical protein